MNTYAPIHTPVRNVVRTHTNDRGLYTIVIKTFAITRQASSMASASLLDLGASSNATMHELAEDCESPPCCARQRTLQQTQGRSTKNCS